MIRKDDCPEVFFGARHVTNGTSAAEAHRQSQWLSGESSLVMERTDQGFNCEAIWPLRITSFRKALKCSSGSRKKVEGIWP